MGFRIGIEREPVADERKPVVEVEAAEACAGIIAGKLIVTGGGLNNPRPLVAATHVAELPAEK